MPSEMETVVTYSNDGSAQSGAGNYVGQSFSINGKQRALHTLNIFSETRASLKDLQLMTFKILAASSGWKYTGKDLVEKIDFVMTDSTAHNLGVIQDVCAELETENEPDSLICNVHPMMMFQRKVKQVCGKKFKMQLEQIPLNIVSLLTKISRMNHLYAKQ